MPNPVVPSRWKALIPSNTGSLCERLSKIFQYPTLRHEDHAYRYTEAGTVSPAYAADFCLLDCVDGGGGTPNPNMGAPSGVNATDGTYSDKIRVSWNALTPPAGVDPVTQYKVYRSLSTNTDPNEAVLVATVDAPTVLYDDEDVVAGTTYNYWVKATNGSDESAFSGYDVGSADAPTGDIDAVTDLRASYGFRNAVTGIGPSSDAIALVWTPPAGATHYDVYRGTTGVFGDAVKIYSDISPAASTTLIHPTNNPTFWSNTEEVLLYDVPPSANTDYIYWVVAKKSSPPAESVESNSITGRVNPPAIYNQSTIILDLGNPSETVPAGITKVWIALRGGGAGGAGGSSVYGGGGGGGPGTVVEEFTVAPGDTIEIVHTPTDPDTGNAASSTDGVDGTDVSIEINSVPMMTADGGVHGNYSASGGGEGGLGGSGTGGAPTIYDGMPGRDSSGASGGQAGYAFGQRRMPQADFEGIFNGDGNTGGYAGSGAKAISYNAAASTGGHGTAGRALIQYGT